MSTVKIYNQAEIAAYELTEQAAATKRLAERASASYGGRKVYRVLVTLAGRSQVSRIIVASSVEHAADYLREEYPTALGVDAWLSSNQSEV